MKKKTLKPKQVSWIRKFIESSLNLIQNYSSRWGREFCSWFSSHTHMKHCTVHPTGNQLNASLLREHADALKDAKNIEEARPSKLSWNLSLTMKRTCLHFKNLPSGSVERHGIKAINLSWSCFNCLRLRIGESILTYAQCSRSCTTCAIFLLTFSVSTMLSEPQEPLLIEYLTSIFHIQTFTLPNSKNRSLYAQLKPGTQCPKTCYLIHYHLLNYMYGTT